VYEVRDTGTKLRTKQHGTGTSSYEAYIMFTRYEHDTTFWYMYVHIGLISVIGYEAIISASYHIGLISVIGFGFTDEFASLTNPSVEVSVTKIKLDHTHGGPVLHYSCCKIHAVSVGLYLISESY
jgi:hypothetical protein